ncbi:MAG: hypothetical protein ACRD0X_08650 [Thermoanaerobaculia bacterium]
MSARRTQVSRWLPALAAAALAVPAASPLAAQEQPAASGLPIAEALPAEGATGAEPGAQEPGAAGERTGDVDIDALLAEDEAVFADDGYAYDAAGRRDPFESLLVARERPGEEVQPRPEGVPGLLISEVDLTGIFILPDGPVAQVQSASLDKSYLLRVGDRLYDGSVVGISRSEVVFRQIVDDPTALKPFREVVKKLNPELE